MHGNDTEDVIAVEDAHVFEFGTALGRAVDIDFGKNVDAAEQVGSRR